MIIILFGLPGAGKTYVGGLIQRHFGHLFYDGDQDVTDAIRDAIAAKQPFTDEMRDEFFSILFSSMERLSKTNDTLVVAQTFIKERYRLQALKHFPEVKFILVETRRSVRELRLVSRLVMPLDPDYARQMEKHFDAPQIEHVVIHNDDRGKKSIIKQLERIFADYEKR